MSENRRTKSEADYIALIRQKANRYLDTPGVTSVGVGYREKSTTEGQRQKATRELCIQFTVAQKLAPEALDKANIKLLPKSISFDDGQEVPVKVIERTFRSSYELASDPESERKSRVLNTREKRRSRLDPIAPGISISHKIGTAGTIGGIVYDNTTGTPLLLSNWHVLADQTEDTHVEIVQPGRIDHYDVENNQIGRLLRSHLGLAGDCAVATIESRKFTDEILALNVVPKRVAKVNLDDLVVKSGRTTGVTYGVVTRVGVTANINYGGITGTKKIGCFEIRPNPQKADLTKEISSRGDSGSIWLIDGTADEQDIVVGLHFAGEIDPDPSEEHALACNIHSVLEKLDVSFVDTVSETVTDEELWNDVLNRLALLENRVTTRVNIVRENAIGTYTTPEDGFPVYGRWCGPGHGGGEPIDDVDRACMEHDKCYGKRGYLDCQCDSQLIADLNRAMGSGKLSPKGYAAAVAISAWFSAQPCFRRIAGVPIPMGTGLTTRILDQGWQIADQTVRGFGTSVGQLVKKVGDGVWRVFRPLF